ncbi:MAG: hypothetical protein VX589_08655 [Myxococcota bacterium]|nr:hypothetical protein [Myxococcota bacterium]
MRVDHMPSWLRPWLHGWGQLTGQTLFTLLGHHRRQIDIKCSGPGRPVAPAIYVIWHEDVIPLFVAMPYLHQPQIWMNHPAWYMKPIHVLLAKVGVGELCLGSTGHDGQIALDSLGQRLVETGSSTTLAVDGPKGPPYQLRKGCLYLAQRTALPIVPVSFICEDAYRLPFHWDRKRIPPLGSTIDLYFHAPIRIAADDDVTDWIEPVISALSGRAVTGPSMG